MSLSLRSAPLCFLILLLAACGGGGGGGAPSNPDPNAEAIAESASAPVTTDGAVVDLPSGATLTVPAGALPSGRQVTFSRISKPAQITPTTTYRIVYEVKGAHDASADLSLAFTGLPDLTAENSCVLRYDPTTMAASELTFTYAADTGAVVATIPRHPSTASAIPRQKVTDEQLASRVVYEAGKPYTAKSTSVIIDMPYYEQVGGSCWAASTAMLLRSWSNEPTVRNLADVLKGMQAPDDDFGLYVGLFKRIAPYLTQVTGLQAELASYYSIDSLWAAILERLDAGEPVLMYFSEWGHAFLVVGYTDGGDKLVIHDPKGMYPQSEGDASTPAEGGMYSLRSHAWFHQMRSWNPFEYSCLIWLPTKPLADRTLQTLGLPAATEAGGSPTAVETSLKFIGKPNPKTPTKPGLTKALLKFKPSALFGTTWVDPTQTEVSTIPSDTLTLELKAPMWNAASTSATRRVRLQVTYLNEVLGDISSDSQTLAGVGLTSDAGKPLTAVTLTLPAEDLRRLEYGNDAGTQPIKIVGALINDQETIYDAWAVLASLSLKPVLSSLSTTSAEIGDTVLLDGGGFGKVQPQDAVVTIGDVEATINSWSDTSISITVPGGAKTGDVRVWLRPSEAYASLPQKLSVDEPALVGTVRNIMFNVTPTTYMYGLRVHAGLTSDVALTTDVISVDVWPHFTPSSGLLGADVPVDYEVWLDGAIKSSGTLTMLVETGGGTAKADSLNFSLGTLPKGKHTIGLILDPSLKLTDPLAPERDTYRIINATVDVVDSYL